MFQRQENHTFEGPIRRCFGVIIDCEDLLASNLDEVSKWISGLIGNQDDDPTVNSENGERVGLVGDGCDWIPLDMRDLDLLEVPGLGFEVDEGGGVANIVEEDESW